MTTPFREPADSPTALALARLEALPVHPIRRLCAALVYYRESHRATPRTNDAARAVARGFASIGRAAEGLLPPARKEVFVDGPRTTQAHLSLRGYFLVTYFESGKCILTWGFMMRTPGSDVLESRATAGSFDADYDAHVEAVRKASTTDAPIVVRDLHTAIALGRFYYRGVIPLGFGAFFLVAMAAPFVMLAIALYGIVRAIVTH